MFSLASLFGSDEQQCNHSPFERIIVADSTTLDGGFVRIYFCKLCKDYRYRDIDHEEGDPHFFEKIRERKYETYAALFNLGKK